MKVGMTLPVMEPALNRDILERWACDVDDGPYSSLAFGERMAFDNPEIMALHGACAIWTKRVRLATTIFVAPLHDPVHLAKHIATVDMLSNGRVTAGFGIGGRLEDYRAVSADPETRKMNELARLVGEMKRVWRRELPFSDMIEPVGPPPIQSGGPPLMAGAQGPKSIKMAANWADGVTGFSFGPSIEDIAATFELTKSAWAEAGKPRPPLVTSFWYAVGDNARSQLQTHLRRYLNWIGEDALSALLPTTGLAGTLSNLRDFLKRVEDVGADEVLLIPTTSDVDEPARIAEIL